LSTTDLAELGLDETNHDIMFATDNTFYTGEFTDQNDGTSPSKRPIALDQSIIYYKVQ